MPNVDERIWTYDISNRVNNNGDAEFVLFNKSMSTIFVENGHLVIKPKITEVEDIRIGRLDLGDSCTSNVPLECSIEANSNKYFLPPVISSLISTKKSFRFKYGRVEIKAKIPKGDWLFPRLVLRPIDDFQPRIKIAVAFGNDFLVTNDKYTNASIDGKILMGGTIQWETKKNNQYTEMKSAKSNMDIFTGLIHFGNEFHTYHVDWRRDSVTFGYDGVTYRTIKGEFKEECYLEIGVSVGGHIEFPDDLLTGPNRNIPKPWINNDQKAALSFWKDRENWHSTWNGKETMVVDYVRVKAL